MEYKYRDILKRGVIQVTIKEELDEVYRKAEAFDEVIEASENIDNHIDFTEAIDEIVIRHKGGHL